MPLYEDRSHAENKIQFDPTLAQQIGIGFEPVISTIVELVRQSFEEKKRPVLFAFDGYYGIDWQTTMTALENTARTAGVTLRLCSANHLYQPQAEIEAYKKRFTEIGDPGFGWVNLKGTVQDIMAPEAIARLRTDLQDEKERNAVLPTGMIVYGPGAALAELIDLYDLVFYFDKTRQPILWDMWEGRLVPFGSDQPKADYHWKEYYYCDYYLLDAQKNFLLPRMDFWVEGIKPDTFKIVPRPVYDTLVRTILKYPIKQVTIFQPGPWGAYRYKDLPFDVPGLECNAWNETAGPELSLLINIEREELLNFPVSNLLQYPVEFVGPYIAEHYPRCFPLDVLAGRWLLSRAGTR